MKKPSANSDQFAAIATEIVSKDRGGMEMPAMVKRPENILPLSEGNGESTRPLSKKIITPGELTEALDALRKGMEPFRKDLAPITPSNRCIFPVKDFQWRVETPSDRADFLSVMQGSGDWEKVSIPHYGPPLGPAATIYRVACDLPEGMMSSERQVICLDAVDYRCQVYLNGVCLGTHEGIFEPFEFDVTGVARSENNTLMVRVENDFTMLGEAFSEINVDGDKVYAATGLGYDDPESGWHHCPPGMGIWQGVRFEGRSRLAITDLYLRPLPSLDAVEIKVEVQNAGSNPQEQVGLLISIYGQNFQETVHTDHFHRGEGKWVRGFGDLEKDMPESEPTVMGPGRNYLSLTLPMPGARLWDLDSPWLYQAQIKLVDENKSLLDTAKRQFGMRSFLQDEDSDPKGKFRLNGREIRLRGANTMGNIDLCVYRGDFDQLRDDILLAKLTNLNFLRLTQHPVQREVYEECDRLGMMLQTDLPLFGSIRRNQFHECVRQCSAMERLVRSHPSNVLVSFINEPFPAARAKPHRFMLRDDMELFFDMASKAVLRENPDRVIKCVDGDYDPPVPNGMQDNHCYCGWYIGHGIDLGRLHHGGWMPVKKGWHFGCGEFGSEGLDSREVMDEMYPNEWLPRSEAENWTPAVIPKAQSMNFHYLWYPTPDCREAWIEASQRHQDWITRLMTESFRRLPGMNTFAIHLFIDAWPAGWMKTIMDVKRIPKRAWFTYRDVLSPVALSLRSDRTAGVSGETIPVELWLANDGDDIPVGWKLDYEVTHNGMVIQRGSAAAAPERCTPTPQGLLQIKLPDVSSRGVITVGATLLNGSGNAVHDTLIDLQVFPVCTNSVEAVYLLGEENSSTPFLRALGVDSTVQTIEDAKVILITDSKRYISEQAKIDTAVEKGATAVFLTLPIGNHAIGGTDIEVRPAGMGPRHFVSCDSGHPIVKGFEREDFKFWCDDSLGYASPILNTVLEAKEWTPVLLSGDGGWGRPWGSVSVAVERKVGKGCLRICLMDLLNRVQTNPAARLFASNLLGPA